MSVEVSDVRVSGPGYYPVDSGGAGLHGCMQFTWWAANSGQVGEGESVGQVVDILIYIIYMLIFMSGGGSESGIAI